MRLEFTKMNGAGNDFILLDNRDLSLALTRDHIVRLCSRQLGVGADGVMLLVPCPDESADWAWQFYNSDGSTADMCGNGARCFARFIQKTTGSRGSVTFLTGAGVITASFIGSQVTINLTPPHNVRLGDILTTSTGSGLEVHSINTGVPHAVVFVPDADKTNVLEEGAEIRNHAHFAPRGTNVNFVQVLGSSRIRVRTFERGVEGETLACGTGVTAAALIASMVHGFKSPVTVCVQSGDQLHVDFAASNGSFNGVKLAGPADFTFSGVIEL